MGRYFGTMNFTRGHNVSCYSKGIPHNSTMWNVMAHRYMWKEGDLIGTLSYCDKYIYRVVEGKYVCIFDSDDHENQAPPTEKDLEVVNADKEEISVGFEHVKMSEYENLFDHYPVFDEHGVCKCCGYKYNPEDMENDKTQFDKGNFCC